MSRTSAITLLYLPNSRQLQALRGYLASPIYGQILHSVLICSLYWMLVRDCLFVLRSWSTGEFLQCTKSWFQGPNVQKVLHQSLRTQHNRAKSLNLYTVNQCAHYFSIGFKVRINIVMPIVYVVINSSAICIEEYKGFLQVFRTNEDARITIWLKKIRPRRIEQYRNIR